MSQELTQEETKVLDKVEKLLALAKHGATEAEAQSATQKAMDLLSAHNLEMSDSSKPTGGDRKNNEIKGGLYKWQRQLWDAVAQLNFCVYRFQAGQTRGRNYVHHVLGRKSNVVATQMMAEYLQQAIDRLAKDYGQERHPGKSVFIRPLQIYREGLSDRIMHRLLQERERILKEEQVKKEAEMAKRRHPAYASSGTGLVLSDVVQSEDDLNTDFLRGLEPGTTGRERAEKEARQAAAQAAYEAEIEERDRREAENPELKEKRLAEEAKASAEAEKFWDEVIARRDKAERTRQRRIDKQRADGTYKGDRPSKTAAERRRETTEYAEGYWKGDDVSLNKQVDEEERKKLG